MRRACAMAAIVLGAVCPALADPFVRSVSASYDQFAACAFQILDREYPTQVQLTDLRALGAIRITAQETAVGVVGSSATRWLDMEVRRAGKGSVVEIRSAPTIFGPNHYAERTWREIRSCLPQ